MICFALSAAIVLLFGLLHLLITLFQMHKLSPRDPLLVAQLKKVPPLITQETTLWRMYVGFNVTHSMGLMLFGLFFLHAALEQPLIFASSPFLRGVGLLTLVAYAVVARLCFFSGPFRGLLLATLLWLLGIFVETKID